MIRRGPLEEDKRWRGGGVGGGRYLIISCNILLYLIISYHVHIVVSCHILSHLNIPGGAKEGWGRYLFKRCELSHWCISQKEIKLAQVLQPQRLKRNVSHSNLWNVSHHIPKNQYLCFQELIHWPLLKSKKAKLQLGQFSFQIAKKHSPSSHWYIQGDQ